jgi:hypothetical protein
MDNDLVISHHQLPLKRVRTIHRILYMCLESKTNLVMYHPIGWEGDTRHCCWHRAAPSWPLLPLREKLPVVQVCVVLFETLFTCKPVVLQQMFKMLALSHLLQIDALIALTDIISVTGSAAVQKSFRVISKQCCLFLPLSTASRHTLSLSSIMFAGRYSYHDMNVMAQG